MAKEIKFTKEEVQQIQTISNQVANTFQRLGELDIRRKQLDDARNQVLEDFNNIKAQEQQLYSKLNEKYGDGNYDPTTNVFTPMEKQEPETADAK